MPGDPGQGPVLTHLILGQGVPLIRKMRVEKQVVYTSGEGGWEAAGGQCRGFQVLALEEFYDTLPSLV